jgi:hypothetical protein
VRVYVDEKCESVRGEDAAGTTVNVRDGARFVKVLRVRAGMFAVAECGAAGRTLGR